MMMGDFNSRSRVDNWVYHYPEDDSRLLVHDYILAETPYIDVVHERHPNDFYTTTGGRARIDYVYCTRPLFDCIVSDGSYRTTTPRPSATRRRSRTSGTLPTTGRSSSISC